MAAPSTDSSRAVWIGWVALAVLVAVVAAVLIQARNQPATNAAPRYSPPSGADITGFQPDAWFLPADDLLGFVEIPAGPFLMGSNPARDPLAFDNERWPGTTGQTTVDVPAFYIGRYEVTVAQFGAFGNATGHRVDERTLRAPANHPVAMITWPDALAYCRWLESVLAGSANTPPRLQQLLRDGWHVGLPSEAQWEKAARGTEGRIYPWGDQLRRDRANFGSAAPVAVGSTACDECANGLADMSGNVWEWTRSPYQPYPFDQADDRKNLEADALWVMRGGSYTDGERNVRAAIRGGADPGARRPFIGFRVVISRGM